LGIHLSTLFSLDMHCEALDIVVVEMATVVVVKPKISVVALIMVNASETIIVEVGN